MRRVLILLIALFFATQAFGQGGTAEVTIPTDEGVVTAMEQCESLRLILMAHSPDWTVPVCASMLTRIGLEKGLTKDLNEVKRSTINACTSTAQTTFDVALNNFLNVEWPLPFIPNVCGDSIVFDTEICDDGAQTAVCDVDCTLPECGDNIFNDLAGEACDDGGESAACNADCTLSICGDGVVNASDGEQCDDGNTTPGDGCDDDCKIELTAGIPTDVHLAWDASNTATGYRIYISQIAGLYTSQPTVDTVGLTAILSNLEPCSDYFAIGTAYNFAGESGPSNEISFKPDVLCAG